jgi:hypothetical protein
LPRSIVPPGSELPGRAKSRNRSGWADAGID